MRTTVPAKHVRRAPPAKEMANTGRLGLKPELRWVPIDQLYVDADYQRSTKSKASQKNLDYIRQNFCWAHCGALTVCFVAETQKYAVIDGQHRVDAARSRQDVDEMPCFIISDLDFRKQATSFAVINIKRVALSSIAAFHAAVAAGDEQAGAVKQLLADCKLEVPSSVAASGDTAPNQTQAVGTLASLIGRYAREHVVWALTIIPEAYGTKRGMLRAQLIKALTEFAKFTPTADRARMVGVLAKLDPAQLEADARSYQAIEGGTTLAAMVVALDRHYQKAGRKGAA